MISNIGTATIVSFAHPLLGADLPDIVRTFVYEDEFFEMRDASYPGRTAFGQLLRSPSIRIVVGDLYSDAPGLALTQRYMEVLVKGTDETQFDQRSSGSQTPTHREVIDFALELDIAVTRSFEDIFD